MSAEAVTPNPQPNVPEGTSTPTPKSEGLDNLTPEQKNEKLYQEVRQLRAEAKDRREKLDQYEKADREKTEAEKTFEQKWKDEKTAHDSTKKQIENERHISTFVSKAVSKGLPEKLARELAPKDLTADNIDESLKAFEKEWKDVIKPSTPTPTTNLPNEASQHTQPATSKGGGNSRREIAKQFVNPSKE